MTKAGVQTSFSPNTVIVMCGLAKIHLAQILELGLIVFNYF